jgi:hypothetical protein
MYRNSFGYDKPPDETTLVSLKSDPSSGPYKWGIIGRHERTLEPIVPAGSIVLIDTHRRVISPQKESVHELQRPIYFLMVGNAYFCGWCELDPLEETLTLLPHPLSPATSQIWKSQEVEIVGRVIALDARLMPG